MCHPVQQCVQINYVIIGFFNQLNYSIIKFVLSLNLHELFNVKSGQSVEYLTWFVFTDNQRLLNQTSSTLTQRLFPSCTPAPSGSLGRFPASSVSVTRDGAGV